MSIALLFAAGLIVISSTAWLTYYIRAKTRFLSKTMIGNANDVTSRSWTKRSIEAYVDSRVILPAPGPWTLDGPAIATLCRLLEDKQPGTVLELGSGLSTVIIASILNKNGGKLVSIDHDESFAEVTRSYLAANAFSHIVDLRIAPLVGLPNNPEERWYDTNIFEDLDGIDLLIVDGPPKDVGIMVRGNALPALYNRLSGNALIFLDDTDREDERSSLEKWKTDFQLPQVNIIGYPKSHAVMKIAR